MTTSCKPVKTELKKAAFRHEIKYEVDYNKAAAIRHKVEQIMEKDINNSQEGSYYVNSLYFETPYNDDYIDKEIGSQHRQKLRLRTYSESGDIFKLELKSKQGDLATKYICLLNEEQAREIVKGNYSLLLDMATAESLYIYYEIKSKAYSPLLTVGYQRYAYSSPGGGFRITFDTQLSYGVSPFSIFDSTVPTGGITDKTILEIKYDNFVPAWLTDMLLKTGINAISSSKYVNAFHRVFD